MYDFLLHNSLYVVLTIAIIVWLGLFGMLFRVDSKLNKIEQQIQK